MNVESIRRRAATVREQGSNRSLTVCSQPPRIPAFVINSRCQAALIYVFVKRYRVEAGNLPMIQLPQRSVTRFFIPLIDVLTLLFCIFLVMPLAKEPGDNSAEVADLEERLRQKEEELERLRESGRDLPRELRDEIDKLRQERGKATAKTASRARAGDRSADGEAVLSRSRTRRGSQ